MIFTADFLATTTSDKDDSSSKTLFEDRLAQNRAMFPRSSVVPKDVGLPSYAEWRSRMFAEAMPHLTIHDVPKPPISLTVTPVFVGTKAVGDIPAYRPYGIVDVTQHERKPHLSNHPQRAWMSNKSSYIPQVGKTFGPTSQPVPPGCMQSAIVSGARQIACARSSGKDLTMIDENFRRMWDLPDDFSLLDYEPTVKPDVSAPWNALRNAPNYSVNYMTSQQQMFTLHAGLATGIDAGVQRDVDWNWVKTCMRAFMTRHVMIDHARTDIGEFDKLVVEFVVRYDMMVKKRSPCFVPARLITRQVVPYEVTQFARKPPCPDMKPLCVEFRVPARQSYSTTVACLIPESILVTLPTYGPKCIAASALQQLEEHMLTREKAARNRNAKVKRLRPTSVKVLAKDSVVIASHIQAAVDVRERFYALLMQRIRCSKSIRRRATIEHLAVAPLVYFERTWNNILEFDGPPDIILKPEHLMFLMQMLQWNESEEPVMSVCFMTWHDYARRTLSPIDESIVHEYLLALRPDTIRYLGNVTYYRLDIIAYLHEVGLGILDLYNVFKMFEDVT